MKGDINSFHMMHGSLIFSKRFRNYECCTFLNYLCLVLQMKVGDASYAPFSYRPSRALNRIAFHSGVCPPSLPPPNVGGTVSLYWKTAESHPFFPGGQRLGKMSQWRYEIHSRWVGRRGGRRRKSAIERPKAHCMRHARQ